MITFEEAVQKLLRQAGWTPERSVPTDKWIRELEKEGFPCSPIAIELLQTLGGLTVPTYFGEKRLFYATPVTFDPLLESSATSEECREWGFDFGVSLCPLGMTEDEMRVLVAPNGSMYAAMSDSFFRYGEDLRSSLNSLLLAQVMPVTLA